MDNKKLIRLNGFINKAYECFSFMEFLKHAIVHLHQFVAYDSGLFYCGISKDCSFFKPYSDGDIEQYYKKREFMQKDEYLEQGEASQFGKEACVYKSSDYQKGVVMIESEPRRIFLESQDSFHIVCIRIVHQGTFLGEIYLHRSKGKADFDDEDLFVLRLMQPHISTIFHIIHTVTAVKYIESGNIPDSTPGICIFDTDLSLTGGNVTGIEMLKSSTIFGSSVLYHIKETCDAFANANRKERTESVLLHSSTLKTNNGDIEINVYLNLKQGLGKKQKYVVIMQYTDKNAFPGEYKFKFTKRQMDIIDGLIQGKNNSMLADSFLISENTVKTHIQNIYKKTGATNRAELTYVLMLNEKQIR